MSAVHTGLTLADVDTIDGCQRRLLNAALLLELGLHHMDGEEVHFDPEAIQQALLDVVDRLREDVTLIAATMEAGGRSKGPRVDGLTGGSRSGRAAKATGDSVLTLAPTRPTAERTDEAR